MISDDDKNELLVEIFELTGQKVGPDDPLVAAALFYSERLRRVSSDHLAEVQALSVQMRDDFRQSIERSVASLSVAADQERLAAHSNYASVIKKAQHAAYTEVPGIKRELEKFAAGLMRQLRKKATPPAEIGLSLRALLGVILVAAVGGGVAAYFWLSQFGLLDGGRFPIFAKVGVLQEPADVKAGTRHAK